MAPDSTPPSRGNPQLDAVDRLRVAALDFRLISSHIKDLAYPLAYGDGEALGEIDDQLQSRLRDLARIEPLLLTVLSDWLQKGCRVGPPCDRDLLPERDARAVAGIRCDSMDPSAHVAVDPPVDCLRKEECDELVRILDAREKALNDEADGLDCLTCRVSATTCPRHTTLRSDQPAAARGPEPAADTVAPSPAASASTGEAHSGQKARGKLKDHDGEAWRLSGQRMKQEAIASKLNDKYGTRYRQYDISRMIARARKRVADSGLAEVIGPDAGRETPTNPRILDLGKRRDGHTRRQRNRGDSDGD